MKQIIAASLLGGTAIFSAAVSIMPLWETPPHDAGTEEWVSRAAAGCGLLAAFAAGLLL